MKYKTVYVCDNDSIMWWGLQHVRLETKIFRHCYWKMATLKDEIMARS